MALTAAERSAMIDRYAAGPDKLRAALAKVPPNALQWRPGPNRWSAHEIIVHCADSEANGALRIRYLLGEATPVIQGYDQERWARELDYHEHPIEPALTTVVAVRANTVPLLRRVTDAQWRRAGRHTEGGDYDAGTWLRIYAEHLEKHAGQIERNLAAWGAR